MPVPKGHKSRCKCFACKATRNKPIRKVVRKVTPADKAVKALGKEVADLKAKVSNLENKQDPAMVKAAKSNGVTNCGHKDCTLCNPESEYNKARDEAKEKKERIILAFEVPGGATVLVKKSAQDLDKYYFQYCGDPRCFVCHPPVGWKNGHLCGARSCPDCTQHIRNLDQKRASERKGNAAWPDGVFPADGCDCNVCKRARKANYKHVSPRAQQRIDGRKLVNRMLTSLLAVKADMMQVHPMAGMSSREEDSMRDAISDVSTAIRRLNWVDIELGCVEVENHDD